MGFQSNLGFDVVHSASIKHQMSVAPSSTMKVRNEQKALRSVLHRHEIDAWYTLLAMELSTETPLDDPSNHIPTWIDLSRLYDNQNDYVKANTWSSHHKYFLQYFQFTVPNVRQMYFKPASYNSDLFQKFLDNGAICSYVPSLHYISLASCQTPQVALREND